MASKQGPNAFAAGTATVSSTPLSIDDISWGWAAEDLGVAQEAVISTASAGIRFTVDGVSMPSTTDGISVSTDASIKITTNPDIKKVNMIRSSAVDSVVTITLWRYPGD